MIKKYRVLLADAIAELSAQKLRTFLTLLGMIFGVGAVIAMLNIGEGAERQALKLIDSMGVNNIIIEGKEYPSEELIEIREESLGLSMGDVDAALATLPFVEGFSASKKIKIHDIYSDFRKSQAEVLGVTLTYFEHANLKLSAGRLLNENDNNKIAQVAVLGFDTAMELFPAMADDTSKMLNQYVKVNHVWLQIIGVLSPPPGDKNEFQGVKIGGDRYRIFLPLSTSVQKFSNDLLTSELDTIKLNISKASDPLVASKAVKQLMVLRHGGIEDYSLIIPAALLEQQKQTQQIFNIVMACVAGISLLVGGIGIMNIMLANVMERTKEIGLLRAVGATQEDIKQQFLAESFAISVLGGILGIIFGLALSEIIGFYSGWAVSWSIPAIFLSLSICMIVGVGFGVFPAIKASKLNPIDALHSD
ncbi:ABC transporter permease [Brumicola pallidula]|jgi:putative ABC transport system permease protein|uniref:Antimicrobial peptide ABC transporter permease n=1 Tax=Brumicola pallidula DSM 14239 = ACAM 615 TaxID=1121922 RepID=K6ZKG7_9ALTE|nr:ABC transporter permease [Glaciecola pallidula]GAC29383.1 antimicrobial peptide ABC transporter permease [Glaciecola pallidula DSM 14239 = ACAM 615]